MKKLKKFKEFLNEIWGEPEDSNFTHNDHNYDLNGILSATLGSEIEQFPISKLVWIFKWDKMTKNDDRRINSADLEAPLLINKLKGEWVVLDGIHRLAKARKLGVEYLPCIKVSDEILNRYII